MEFHFRMYGVSRRMCYVRVTYVWRMQCTRDVSTPYVLRSILICGVSVLYQFLFIAPAYSRVRYRSPNFRPYSAVTLSRIDSRIYGVSRYERYVTRTSHIREHT